MMLRIPIQGSKVVMAINTDQIVRATQVAVQYVDPLTYVEMTDSTLNVYVEMTVGDFVRAVNDLERSM